MENLNLGALVGLKVYEVHTVGETFRGVITSIGMHEAGGWFRVFYNNNPLAYDLVKTLASGVESGKLRLER